MTEFDSADVPAFREWRSGFQSPPDASAFLAEHLSIASALLFAELLAPDLVFERGCVIVRARYSPENFEQWWLSEAGDTARIERALNHLHLWDIFDPAGEQEERAVEALAGQIACNWALHAAREFPDREFQTDVVDDYGPTVVMSSRRRGAE